MHKLLHSLRFVSLVCTCTDHEFLLKHLGSGIALLKNLVCFTLSLFIILKEGVKQYISFNGFFY